MTTVVYVEVYRKNLFSSNEKCEYFSGFEKDPKRSRYEIHGRIPRLTIRGSYRANGRVILLPVVGDGAATMTFGKIDTYYHQLNANITFHIFSRKR